MDRYRDPHLDPGHHPSDPEDGSHTAPDEPAATSGPMPQEPEAAGKAERPRESEARDPVHAEQSQEGDPATDPPNVDEALVTEPGEGRQADPTRPRSAWVDPDDPRTGRPALSSWPRPSDTQRIDRGQVTNTGRVADAPDDPWASGPVDRARTNPAPDPEDVRRSVREPTSRVDRLDGGPVAPVTRSGPPTPSTPPYRPAEHAPSARDALEVGANYPYGGGADDDTRTASREAYRPWLIALIGGLSGAIAAAVLFVAAGFLTNGNESAPSTTAIAAQSEPQSEALPASLPLDADGGVVSAVAARTIPSIAAIQIFATPGEPSSLVGAGSGVVYSGDGLIITNSHVIADAAEVRVSLSDGRTYVAEVVGEDPVTDIAVVRIPTSDVTPIRLADMDRVGIGDIAIAIGNPLGLEGGPSVTSGVVSAFRRELEVDPFTRQTLYGLLQTDAPITRGSSGGALVDDAGALLGITTAIGVSDVGAEGLGFAVPANLAESIVVDLIEDGRIRHAFLGIEGRPAFATREGAEVPVGAEILDLTPGSAIGSAGARPGDVIVSLHGSQVTSMNTLVAELRMFRAGDIVNVGLLRNGERVDLSLTLDEREE